jgi:phosphopantetheinyl transferase (holo-ACP synthase)
VCEQLGIREILVTISHCRTYATAVAIAVGEKKEK